MVLRLNHGSNARIHQRSHGTDREIFKMAGNLEPSGLLGESKVVTTTWRFMGSYKHGYTSSNTGYNFCDLTSNPTYNYP